MSINYNWVTNTADWPLNNTKTAQWNQAVQQFSKRMIAVIEIVKKYYLKDNVTHSKCRYTLWGTPSLSSFVHFTAWWCTLSCWETTVAMPPLSLSVTFNVVASHCVWNIQQGIFWCAKLAFYFSRHVFFSSWVFSSSSFAIFDAPFLIELLQSRSLISPSAFHYQIQDKNNWIPKRKRQR